MPVQLRDLPAKGGYRGVPGAPPPMHVYGNGHVPQAQYAGPAAEGRAVLYGARGGLMGGVVVLSSRGFVGMRAGDTGYGYLGNDPSDSSTWTRPFRPAPGMIGYLNWQVT
jgi:hypothetical protein